MKRCLSFLTAFAICATTTLAAAQAQQPGDAGGRDGAGREGRGGRGGGNQERPIVAQFDVDKDGRLNAAERAGAVEFINANPIGRGGRGGGRGGGGGGGRGGNRPPASPGEKLTPADVENFPDAPLYDAKVLRTFFIDFENPNWEAELVAFNNTDVE